MFGLDKSLILPVEKQVNKFQKVLKSSLKVKGEDLLIISDYGTPKNTLASMIGYGYHHAANKKGVNSSLLFQEPKKGFMSADSHVVNAIKKLEKNNLIILALSNKLGRFGDEKSFRTFCKEKNFKTYSNK